MESHSSSETFADRLARVEEAIAAACRGANRPRSELRLMAVSKMHPASALQKAMASGVRLFGENRVQEYQQKAAQLSSAGAPPAEVHLIGHLQSNKAAKAAEIFSAIDTVDSLRLAERLHEAASRLGKTLPVLLEIKLSQEESKTGLDPGGREIGELLERLPGLSALSMRGLMTVAPLAQDIEVARSCFRSLRKLRDDMSGRHPRLDFTELSMGMSGDFAVAIQEGSTCIRIGTALFGAREAMR
jgi:pyridoxal phosphate enzyme (YggS family)